MLPECCKARGLPNRLGVTPVLYQKRMQLFGQSVVAFKRKNIGLSCKKTLLIKRLCRGILAGMRRVHLNFELRHGAGAGR